MQPTSNLHDFTILLVDKKQESNNILQTILQKPNRKFLTANSGNEAFKKLKQNPLTGLVMLHMELTDMDGFQIAQQIKSNARTKNVSIIFINQQNVEEHFVQKGFDEGMIDYLQTPLDIHLTKAKVNMYEKLYFSQNDFRLSCDELEKVNKQLENFVHVVSHDLKSPLASIVTILSTLKGNKGLEADADLHGKIDMVSMIAFELTEMIESILTYSKQSLKEQQIEQVDTAELIHQVVFLLMPPENMDVTITGNLPVINTRRQKLQQVFLNLISNAIKYNDKEEGLIEVDALEKDECYIFSVKDNGPGIDDKDQNKIFNLFETSGNTSNRESSTGVGLNIIKVIVEEQGGNVWVETKAGIGSVFYFEWRKQQ